MTFRERVFELVKKIPIGRVSTYVGVAKALGSENKARAVGNALNLNEKLITMPCHRVVKSTGEIGGYKLGAERKIELLKEEGVEIMEENGKFFVDLDKYFHKL